jgi:RNA-directed DNA polymerase
MSEPTEAQPAAVPHGAQQVGDTPTEWTWVERQVWTQRMLTALENGVKGGKWFRLIDKVYAPRTLAAAFTRVMANHGAAGVDHQTVKAFKHRLDANLKHLTEALQARTYRPQAIRRVYIPKPGRPGEQRPLGIPTVRDRVVQTALRSVIEPIFEVGFAGQSYGFRPNRGCKDALRRVKQLLAQGNVWVVDADLKSYFDTIPHDRMMERVKAKIADGRVLELIESFLQQGVMGTAAEWEPDADEGRGTPQGAVISPLLANVYLDPLDHLMEAEGLEMVRYADDFVILCPSEQEARRALDLATRWTQANGLVLHPDKTRVVRATGTSFDFLGYRFQGNRHWPTPKSVRRFKDAIRDKTRRTRGESLQVIITDVNRTTRGWFNYFKHSRPWRFVELDAWIRMRLRSVLRRHRHERGRGRGRDHYRWPNAFFAARGLFSMKAAYAAACQSARR